MTTHAMRAALSAMLPGRKVRVSVQRATDASDFDSYRLTFDGIAPDERARVDAWLATLGLRRVSAENVGSRYNWVKVWQVWPIVTPAIVRGGGL